MNRETIMHELIANHGWNPRTLDLAIRARFRCEYCGRNIRQSIDDYDGVVLEHIKPKHKYPELEYDDNNIAISCRLCNHLKHTWNPSDQECPDLSREELIQRVKDHLKESRENEHQRHDIVLGLIAQLTSATSKS